MSATELDGEWAMSGAEQKAKKVDLERARRNTRGRFEQWAKNPTCEANTISAVRNIRMSAVARAEGLPDTFGQSPFAIARGETFEKGLFRKEAEDLIEKLIEHQVLPEGASGLLDLRLKMNGGTKIKTLEEALEQTEKLLLSVATAKTKRQLDALPALAAAATVRIPRGVMLPEAILIIDVLAINTSGERPLLVVGEVKTYPDRGGYTSAGELAGARAQAGIYVHALDVVLREMGIESRCDLSRAGFLVLTRPGGNTPSIRANEDFRYQEARAARGFELLERAAQALPSTLWGNEDDGPDELIAAVQHATTAYNENCLSFCDRAPGCHRSAMEIGDGIVLGDDIKRLLGEITLHRTLELMNGVAPANAAEEDLKRQLDEAGMLNGHD
jgi:hypothetical protein